MAGSLPQSPTGRVNEKVAVLGEADGFEIVDAQCRGRYL